MRQKKWASALAIVGALTLGLGACSSGTDSQSDTQASDDEVVVQEDTPPVDKDPDFPLPEVLGAFGEAPTITPVDENPPTEITYKLLSPGDGSEVHVDGLVTVNYAGFLWDGKPFDSSFSRGEPSTFSLNSVIAGWKYGLAGSKVGDRVLLIIPPEYGYGSVEQGDIPADSTLVFVVDILDTPGSDVSALGEAEFTDEELPEGLLVEGTLGEQPVIGFEEDVEAPAEPAEVVIAEGSGPVITESDTVIYHYSGVYWGTPNTADSTWTTGPTTMPARGSVFLGQHVGSRIAMVFPSEDESTPATVMVIDIVGAYK